MMNLFGVILFLLSFQTRSLQALDGRERKTYIIYMGTNSLEVEQLHREHQHHELLVDVIGDAHTAKQVRLYSYGKSFNGFAARLLPHEAAKLKGYNGVVSVFPSTKRKLATTRSWDYLGLSFDLQKRNHKLQSDVIIGLLDSGIYMGAPSFDDAGYGPVPHKWKGKCDKGENFTGCNRKVIGARFFSLGDIPMNPTPADDSGHGTHTSSTAAGNGVSRASLYGLAEGTARGGAPGARIAMYKVCGEGGYCSDASLLAAFDTAIADGVDLISLSIGTSTFFTGIPNFFEDSIAIGAFHAMKKGVLTMCAAGNDGPLEQTVSNVAPWVITVAATNTDRQFKTKVKLGNDLQFEGSSINTYTSKKTMYPLISSARAYNASGDPSSVNASTCDTGTLEESKVRGKIVFCLATDGSLDYTVKKSKGFGAVTAVDYLDDVPFPTVIPALVVSAKDGELVAQYINTTKSPEAHIYKTTEDNDAKSPVVPSFSSRGPQFIARNILKPDIGAPGLAILAAYTKLTTITEEALDNRFSVFNILSGTSMATPHVTGAAAYVKSFRPTWSTAAIKSALMTTAKPVDGTGVENPLHSGSGLISPVDAVYPGLIYDLSMKDYIRYLCREGYNSTTLAMLSGDKIPHECTESRGRLDADGLNYPSMHLQLLIDQMTFSYIFHRTVTNVGSKPSVYRANVTAPDGLSIKVIPHVLSFAKPLEKKSFKIVVTGDMSQVSNGILIAFLEWKDSYHSVRSPIVVYKPILN